jgi:hypothetical protein
MHRHRFTNHHHRDIITSTKIMIAFSLQSLLNIPLEHIPLVVDNARSPEHAVSFQKRPSRRKPTKRSCSWDGINVSNRWSSMPSSDVDQAKNITITPGRKSRPSRRNGAVGRSRSSDDTINFFESGSARPLRKPSRQTSPKRNSPSRITSCPIQSISIQTQKQGFDYSLTQSMTSTLPTNIKPLGKSSGNLPLRIPIRQQSPRTVCTNNAKVQDSIKKSFPPALMLPDMNEKMTTLEMLTKALGEDRIIE